MTSGRTFSNPRCGSALEDVFSSAYLETTIEGQPVRFPLPSGSTCRIGRTAENEICLPDGSTSRNHAMLQHTDQGMPYLSDLGSRNGTFVNGHRVTKPVLLACYDVIDIGDYTLTFHHAETPRQPLAAGGRIANSTVLRLKQELVTVLVADIRDYTGLAARMGEGRISSIIGVFMREAGEILERRGSWAQKYIGDAVMAVWVHRSQVPEWSEMSDVLRSAAELTRIAESLEHRFTLDTPIRIGIGINTGVAATGNMGSAALADYTALGDVVNKAFRLESATKEIGCDVAVGRNTHDFLDYADGAEEVLREYTVRLKGYPEPEQIFAFSHSSLERLCGAVDGMTPCSGGILEESVSPDLKADPPPLCAAC